MPLVRITNQCMQQIRDLVPFRQVLLNNGIRQPDGTWLIPLQQETLDRIVHHCLEGESVTDCLERVTRRTRLQ